MIPQRKPRELKSSGISRSGSFEISHKDSAHLMTILRDTLYSDKILAVLREYSSNAWDAHREAGKGDVPIKVTLPTTMEPTLVIRDFGLGLSPDDVFEVYTQYGASTKRDNDVAVGMLGIGSKSGFAYSDSFTVISYHDGMKRTYVAVLDESNKGAMNLLCEEECGDETGIEIQIPILQDDIPEFSTKARYLFRYFDPRPDINIDLPEPDSAEVRLENGIISEDGRQWIAVMGCVPYRIDLYQLKEITDYSMQLSGALFFDIGDVQINASREELKYTDDTKKALVEKLSALFDEYITTTLDLIEKQGLSPWERRIRMKMISRFKIPVPDKYKRSLEQVVNIDLEDSPFTITRGKERVSRIWVGEKTRLIIRDERRALAGYYLSEGHRHIGSDYLVRPATGTSLEEVKKNLLEVVKKADLVGIPICNISDIPWTRPHTTPRGLNSNKYSAKSFQLRKNASYFGAPYSDHWEPVTRTPADDDVFVILRRFVTDDMGYYFYTLYRRDRDLAKALKIDLPEVYGYKETEKKPLDPSKIPGTHYPEWRKKFIKSLYTPDKENDIRLVQWAQYSGFGMHYRSGRGLNEKLNKIEKKLGSRHPIIQMFRRNKSAKKKLEVLRKRGLVTLTSVLEEEGLIDKVPPEEVAKVTAQYPMIDTFTDLSSLLSSDSRAPAMLDYIKLVDKGRKS